MLPVAYELQADSARMTFETMRASIASILDPKVADAFRKGLDMVHESAQKKTGRSDVDEQKPDAADQMLKGFALMGMVIPPSKKKKRKS